MNRDLWDALVFDAYEEPTANPMISDSMQGLPLDQRRTLVIRGDVVPTIRICLQSADESLTGERLAAYSDPAWWARHIRRFTNVAWNGTIQTGSCTGEPPEGWVYIREGEDGEITVPDRLARADSWRSFDPHGIRGRWHRSRIIWHPDRVRDTVRNSDEWMEGTLAHELGHVLGLWHVNPASGFVMLASGGRRTYPDDERWLAQWAYRVGPNVQYPGLLRPTATAPGDLKGGVKDLVDEALADLQDDSDESNGRQAAESVPALPIAGVLLLAIVLGLLGGRRVRAGRHR